MDIIPKDIRSFIRSKIYLFNKLNINNVIYNINNFNDKSELIENYNSYIKNNIFHSNKIYIKSCNIEIEIIYRDKHFHTCYIYDTTDSNLKKLICIIYENNHYNIYHPDKLNDKKNKVFITKYENYIMIPSIAFALVVIKNINYFNNRDNSEKNWIYIASNIEKDILFNI